MKQLARVNKILVFILLVVVILYCDAGWQQTNGFNVLNAVTPIT
ncbi:hypothetical protein [Alkaliflexus imshenetskii]|nr:hypothetical protein [Alkaliflexus imshenetskii]